MAGGAFAQAPEPLVQMWAVNPSANQAIRAILPEVHSVEVSEKEVVVRSAGLTLHSLGAIEANGYEVPTGVRSFAFRFPRQRRPATERVPIALGIIGALLTGVPIFNPASTASYQGQNLWHRDAVALDSRQDSPLVSATGRHSPLIGFALDGYPIYGPFGWDKTGSVKRMRSSYRLRQITQRQSWPDGTELLPSQGGPDVNRDNPLGTFTEDYEYVAGSGDLDESNSRWAVTPEYAQGIYAYFLSTSDEGRLAFPYLIGPTYRGQVDVRAKRPNELRVEPLNRKGKKLVFLETVHEMPVHLLIVSEDLSEFAHIHPLPVPGGGFAIEHQFPYSGRYHLYADYSVPGEGPVVKHWTVLSEGLKRPPAKLVAQGPWTQTIDGIEANLVRPEVLRTGVDMPIELKLSVTDLDPYLGAWAHFVAVSEDHEDFIHAHPAEALTANGLHDHSSVTGPSPEVIRSSIGFRRPGKYRLWAQIQHRGKGITIPFGLVVVAGKPAATLLQIPPGAVRVDVSASGFVPARLSVKAEEKIRIAFVRKDAQNCGGVVRFPSLGITRELTPGSVTVIEVQAPRDGSLAFTCGMGMMRGAILVSAP